MTLCDKRFEKKVLEALGEVNDCAPPVIDAAHFWDIIIACRYALQNLVSRRRDVLLQEQASKGLTNEQLKDHQLTNEEVEHYMRQLHKDFEQSHAQRVCIAADAQVGLSSYRRT